MSVLPKVKKVGFAKLTKSQRSAVSRLGGLAVAKKRRAAKLAEKRVANKLAKASATKNTVKKVAKRK